jgi:hypothetical protein
VRRLTGYAPPVTFHWLEKIPPERLSGGSK